MNETAKSKRCLFLKAKLAVVYKQLVILEPDNINAHMRRGDLCYELKKYKETIAAFKEAIRRLQSKGSFGPLQPCKSLSKVGQQGFGFGRAHDTEDSGRKISERAF